MSIKSIYKEVESAKKNKVKEEKMVYMSLEDFIKEHTELPRILRSGTKEEREAEAKRQEEELEEELEGENEEESEDNEDEE